MYFGNDRLELIEHALRQTAGHVADVTTGNLGEQFSDT
jgi:hypothetical protein